jgi:hypothetical protein
VPDALAGKDARTQQRSMLALIPLASATDAIDAWGSRANEITTMGLCLTKMGKPL